MHPELLYKQTFYSHFVYNFHSLKSAKEEPQKISLSFTKNRNYDLQKNNILIGNLMGFWSLLCSELILSSSHESRLMTRETWDYWKPESAHGNISKIHGNFWMRKNTETFANFRKLLFQKSKIHQETDQNGQKLQGTIV